MPIDRQKPKKEQVRGFSRLNTDEIASHADRSELTVVENMVWNNNNALVIRNGSTLYKSNTQFTDGVGVKFAKDIDYLDGNGAFEFYAYDDGSLAYNTVSSYTDSTTSFTQVNSLTGSTPALNTSTSELVFMATLNKNMYITDGSENIYRIPSTKTLTLVADPVGFSFEMTVNASVAVAEDDEYEDDDDTTRTFIVTETKATTVGTTIKLRQTAGATRPTTGGSDNLSRTSGTGDANVAYTAITYPEKFVSVEVHNSDRLLVASDAGRIYISDINNGANFTTSGQTMFVNYGLTESLSFKNMTPFKRATLLTFSNDNLENHALATLTGFRIPSTSSLDTRDGLLSFRRESSTLGFAGRSAQEIGNSGIGLTRTSGFVTFTAAAAQFDFGITDNETVSDSIKSLVQQINWDQSDKIVSAVDRQNQRYYCAVPLNTSSQLDTIFVYDFGSSVTATSDRKPVNRWSVFTYNLGDGNEIQSLFRLRNKLFMGSSDGNILELDVADTYTDNGVSYPTQLRSIAFDLGDKSSIKEFEAFYSHFLIGDESITLDIFSIVDEQTIDQDFRSKAFSQITVEPRSKRIEAWTDDSDDTWTVSAFDKWEDEFANEVSVPLINSVPDGQQIQILIRDLTGGKFWGVAGFTLEMSDYSDVEATVSIT